VVGWYELVRNARNTSPGPRSRVACGQLLTVVWFIVFFTRTVCLLEVSIDLGV
jgi:hypothetical protein